MKRYPANWVTNSLDIEAGKGARVEGDPWIFRVPGWWFSIYARPLELVEPPRGLRIDGTARLWIEWECDRPCDRPEGAAACCKHCPAVDLCSMCDRWVVDHTAHDDWHASSTPDTSETVESDRHPTPDECALEQLTPEEAYE